MTAYVGAETEQYIEELGKATSTWSVSVIVDSPSAASARTESGMSNMRGRRAADRLQFGLLP